MPSADEKCPGNRRATVTDRWFGGCAGSEVCCAPNDEPATALYALRAAWFVNRAIRTFAATHACPDSQPVVRCSARARHRREPRKPGQIPPSCAERIPKVHIHRSPSNPLCACSLLDLTGPSCGENDHRQSVPEGPRQHSAPPQHSGAPIPALRSISRAPTTDRGCL